MSVITAMNLAAIDLNLFLVLNAVLRERSATGAARQLHLTQSAVSNSLARLRVLLKDPLFVRSGRGLIPTPRTRELAPFLESALTHFQAALGPKGPFDATQSTRRFSISCADNSQVRDIPQVVAALAREMPRAGLRVVSADYLLARGGFAHADIDAALISSRAARGLRFEPLYREYGVMIVRQKHPEIATRVTRETFNRLQHIDVFVTLGESGASRNSFEKILARHGLARRVALSVPSFTAAAIAAVETDYVACIPRRAAEALAKYLPLRIVPLPIPEFHLEVGLAWHPKTHTDPGCAHFRKIVIDALRDQSVKSKRP